MITPNAGLPVSLQCSLLGITRSSFYYQSLDRHRRMRSIF
jgi:hypothetical protein